MKKIHFVETHHSYRLLDPSRGLYETGDWVFALKSVAATVGAELHLHQRQADPSYLAGHVVGWRKVLRTGFFQRYALEFIVDPAATGAITDRGGWRRERKVVR
ncbi:MAG: hypothetical protein Q8N13_03205 [Acidovorax sp.]|jgi:hypothetical protein|nr:hypothetical protein [Acidovorax sp.]